MGIDGMLRQELAQRAILPQHDDRFDPTPIERTEQPGKGELTAAEFGGVIQVQDADGRGTCDLHGASLRRRRRG